MSYLKKLPPLAPLPLARSDSSNYTRISDFNTVEKQSLCSRRAEPLGVMSFVSAADYSTGVPHVSEKCRHTSRHDWSPILLADCSLFRWQNVEMGWENLQEAMPIRQIEHLVRSCCPTDRSSIQKTLKALCALAIMSQRLKRLRKPLTLFPSNRGNKSAFTFRPFDTAPRVATS